MRKEPEQFFQEFKQDVTTYVELKAELLKLEIYERAGKGISALSYALIVILLVFFLILFISVAIGFFLGDRFGSVGIGFLFVAAFYLLLTGIAYLLRNKIRTRVLNDVIAAFMTNKKQENNENATDTISTITE
ncbi:MAG: phage holin family protein [Tannerella sp.]|jgi:hypothetical protein|nr:phage holin family protein [Tannerella sp.]